MSHRDSRREFMKGALGAGVVAEAGLTAGESENRPGLETVTGPKPRIMFYQDGRPPSVLHV